MAGSYSLPGVIILIAYLVHVLSLVLGRKKPFYYFGSLIAIIAITYAVSTHDKFWKNENQNTCQKLKTDPYCRESETGFTCSEDSKLGNLVVSKSICNQ